MSRSRDELSRYMLETLHHVAPEADLSQLNPEKNLRRQLRVDSLDFLKIVLIIHRDTGYTVPESDYRKLFTFKGLLDYFEGKI